MNVGSQVPWSRYVISVHIYLYIPWFYRALCGSINILNLLCQQLPAYRQIFSQSVLCSSTSAETQWRFQKPS
jgi:hypothetical protein